MQPSRRDFLKGLGALVVSFHAAPAVAAVQGQTAVPAQGAAIDPKALDSWLAVSADGKVTAFTGKCDLGQGIGTAQVQLVAEELCVALEQVQLVQCDTALTPDQGSTSGSQSTPTNFNDRNLALAAATAREALLAMAAALWRVPVAQLTVVKGTVQDGTGRQCSYADLLRGRHFDLALDPKAERRPRKTWTVLGKPVPSLDRHALMTGTFPYIQHVRVAGMAHGRVVRPPAVGATLVSVEPRSVAHLRGIVRIVTRRDFVGVVAETQYAAAEAARLLQVTWKSGPALPPYGDFFDHVQHQPSQDAVELDSGDVSAVIPRCRHLVSAQYTYAFQSHGSLAASCAVADVRGTTATVWSATQSVYPTRSCIAMLLGFAPEQVRVIYTRSSGCYGLNGADAASFDAAVLSQESGRPVRLQYTRGDEMRSENYGSAVLVKQRGGVDAEGNLLFWDREGWVPSLGNRPGYDRPGNIVSGMLLGFDAEPLKAGGAQEHSGPLSNGSNTVPEYMAGCVDGVCGGSGTVRSERVLTHTVRAPFFTGPLRAPLRIQNTFANESFMDELSHAAGIDPLAFRLQHLHHDRLITVLQAVSAAAGWHTAPAWRATPNPGSVRMGRGLACVAYEGKNGFAALVAHVAVDLASGEVRPLRFVLAIDCGPVSNPDGLRNQVEGGLLQGTSRALVEEITWNRDGVTSTDWETYQSLHLDLELPTIEVVSVEPEGVQATGAGETAITVTPAALANAIFDAAGIRLRDVPFTPARVLAALRARDGRQGAAGDNAGDQA